MYDYISIYSQDYSTSINKEIIEEFLLTTLKFSKDYNLEYYKEIFNQKIKLRGILANSGGNYAFNSYDEFNEINLIEIDIPNSNSTNLEDEIISIAKSIAKEYSWLIDHRE